VNFIGMSLVVLGLALLVLLTIEVRNYRAGRTLISRRRLGLRVAAGALLLSLLAAVYVGLFVLRLESAVGRERLFLVYWSSCLAVAIALVWVMLADLQEVEDRFSQRQHEIWHEMARFVAHQIKAEKETDGGSKSDTGTREADPPERKG
jgi:hypothetical protein